MPVDDRTRARLVLRRPDGEDKVFALETGQPTTLGRDAGNTIVLASRFVSKRHALMSWTPRGLRIEDRDSSNGMTVNGLAVHVAELSTGDVIHLGDQRLDLEIDVEPPADITAPVPSPGTPGRLVAASLVILAMIGGVMGVYVMRRPRASAQAATTLTPTEAVAAGAGANATRVRTGPGGVVSSVADVPIALFDSAEAQAVAQQAVATGEDPVGALFDAAKAAYDKGRILEAYRLLNGALVRNGQHQPSQRLLLPVKTDRDTRLHGLQATAAQAEQQGRWDEAAEAWKAMQALTLEYEPLHVRARAEATRLRQRAAQ
jgi:pSer/pThr/pTyr-binding forkhead associated (FHA) protein